MSTTTTPAPMPSMKGLTAQFYRSIHDRGLQFQHCTSCDNWQFPPREICPRCGCTDLRWEAVGTTGRIFTWTVVERPMHPAYLDVPYVVVVVEFPQGPRLMGRLLDVSPDDVSFDCIVRLEPTPVGDDFSQITFRMHGENS